MLCWDTILQIWKIQLYIFHETPHTIPKDHTTLISFLHVFSMWVLQVAVSQMKSYLSDIGNCTHHSHKTRWLYNIIRQTPTFLLFIFQKNATRFLSSSLFSHNNLSVTLFTENEMNFIFLLLSELTEVLTPHFGQLCHIVHQVGPVSNFYIYHNHLDPV